jgi:hypothetical protein
MSRKRPTAMDWFKHYPSPKRHPELYSVVGGVLEKAEKVVKAKVKEPEAKPVAEPEAEQAKKMKKLMAIARRDSGLLKLSGMTAQRAFGIWKRAAEGLKCWAEMQPDPEQRREILEKVAASEARMQAMIDRHRREHREYQERRIEKL